MAVVGGTGSRALWLTCLASALRTAIACSIVACATLYGPISLRRQVTYPAFSYVTTILIVNDAALGDAIRGCWLALFATAQTVCPAILVFWFIGPTKFSNETIALTVALASVIVVVPESTHLVGKRIALGQLVLIYVVGFIQGERTHPLMHPVHVAASTAMGVVASLIATLLPFPRLASLEVKEKSKVVAVNAAERLSLLVKALNSDDDTVAVGSISKAQSLSSSATKLISIIKRYQESMQWERLPFKIFRMGWLNNSQRLQDLGIPLRGMELALSNIPSYPIELLDQNQAMKDGLNGLEKHICFTLKQANSYSPSDSLTFPESTTDDLISTVQSLQIMPTKYQDLPPFFFIFCMKFLQNKCHQNQYKLPKEKPKQGDENPNDLEKENKNWFSSLKNVVLRDWASQLNSKRLMPALKCALSLSLAVFLGLIYSKENGFWASLPVAISFVSGREATFKVANVKIQGTVLGSVYGVLSFVLFQKFLPIRLLSLLPWFVFTCFLQRSRMYGPAGGISAVIGAVLVLGRINFGSPSEFAMARIVETFIGLSSSIMVDILLQPTRASKMSKIQLILCFQTLQKCIDSLSLGSSVMGNLEKNQKSLNIQVCELKKFMDEAQIEPNFWYLPFQSNCYIKLFKSLSKMVDFFAFCAHAIKNIEQNLPIMEDSLEKLAEELDLDLGKFKELMNVSMKCYEEVTSMKSLRLLEKEAEKRDGISIDDHDDDLEMGNIQEINNDEMEIEKLIHSFLQHSSEVVDNVDLQEGESENEDGKSQVVINLSALGFCLRNLMKETQEIGEAIRELVQGENPSSHVDLNEITCKLHALQK